MGRLHLFGAAAAPIVVSLAGLAGPAAAATYLFTSLTNPDAAGPTVANGVNNKGQVVGDFGAGRFYRGTKW